MGDDRFDDWMDVESNGSVQMGVQDNNVFYQGFADYLGAVPEGMVLGVSTGETADGDAGHHLCGGGEVRPVQRDPEA
ncbi:MAG: hypothetical protein ACLT9S_00100 [Faecalibacterium sp.]